VRIAVAVPVVKRVQGNRLAFCLTRALTRAHEVTVYTETAFEGIVPEVERQIAPARFRALRVTSSDRLTNLELLSRQLRRGPDRRICAALRADHRGRPFDVVIVFANEGHWIAEYVASWDDAVRPTTVLVLLDPVEQVFLLARDRPFAAARELLMPLYPLLHAVESRRVHDFDRVFTISRWVSELASFLYGIGPSTSVAAVDAELFKSPTQLDDARPYVAVPTASLRPSDGALLALLARQGVPLVTFGPRGVPGLPHRGYLPDAELVTLLAAARATLFLFDYEGLGLIPLESLAVGTPVITLPHGGPFVELRDNPHLRFASDPATLVRLCKESLPESRSRRDPDRIRASIGNYFASEVADRWSQALETART
jgi:hypothetical protein